jgi:elongation factor Ts
MAEISALQVKNLREATGAGMADCKKALVECDGDLDKATEYLRRKGIASAAKKAGRVATEGQVSSYVHAGGRIGVLVEVNCETDFVAKTEDFQSFVKEIGLQIAAMNPLYLEREQVPAEVVAKERAIRFEQAKSSGKPDAVIEKMVDGQIAKWLKEIVLLEQGWVKDDKKDIQTLVKELIGKLGENVKIRRFVRFELGEGLEKRQDDFVAEVAAQVQAKA